MTRPTYYELAKTLEDLIAACYKDGEIVAPDEDVWGAAWDAWAASGVAGMPATATGTCEAMAHLIRAMRDAGAAVGEDWVTTDEAIILALYEEYGA